MKKPFSSEQLEFCLKKSSEILISNNIEHFIHGGVLLGYARDGKPLENDDDIDIVLSHKYWDRIHELFEKELGWYLDNQGDENSFIGFMSPYHGIHVDFYFYYDEGDFIREKWNYFGKPHDKNFHILIPKSMVFPLKIINGISFPASPEKCSEYTYGEKWNEPTGRNGYQVEIINNTPKITYL